MAHIELSLTELAGMATAHEPSGTLDRWGAVVARAQDPCLLLDANGCVVEASPGCAALLSLRAADAVGRPLVDGVLRLLDFNLVSSGLPEWEIDKIPPLLAIRSGELARGLLRIKSGAGALTVDAISTPLREGGAVVGSLSFFAAVGP
jgi:PAS domain-containing protein